MNREDQQTLLKQVYDCLAHSAIRYELRDYSVRVIDGREEAGFLWLAANYMLGRFDPEHTFALGAEGRARLDAADQWVPLDVRFGQQQRPAESNSTSSPAASKVNATWARAGTPFLRVRVPQTSTPAEQSLPATLDDLIAVPPADRRPYAELLYMCLERLCRPATFGGIALVHTSISNVNIISYSYLVAETDVCALYARMLHLILHLCTIRYEYVFNTPALQILCTRILVLVLYCT